MGIGWRDQNCISPGEGFGVGTKQLPDLGLLAFAIRLR